MDAVTYPSEVVQDVLGRHTAPVRLDILKEREMAKRLRPVWTPSFMYLAPDGREFHRALGFLPPADFAAQVLVGVGLSRLQAKRTDRALDVFGEALERFPSVDAAPEARYWSGVCNFKRTKDTTPIYEACREIVERWPGSAWAKKLGFVTKYKDFNLT